MEMRRLPISKPASLLHPITRPLTAVTFTLHRRHDSPPPLPPPPPSNPPPPPDPGLLTWVSSLLSNPSLDSSKLKPLLPILSPLQFDLIFFSIRPHINPKTALHFFHIASSSFGFRFALRSYCVLIHSLITSNVAAAARLLLIRLIDGNISVSSSSSSTSSGYKHVEIANAFCEFNERRVEALDMLLHVYCTQFKHLGLNYAVDVFDVFADEGVFPSLKMCNYFLSGLVKANELEMSYRVFEAMCRGGVSPDVCLFTTAVNALCKGGRVDDAIGLFTRMERSGVAPNVVTYNSVIHGLCKSRRLEEAFKFKEKMVDNNVRPSLVTYSVLVNDLIKQEMFNVANCVFKEMRCRGFVPNEVLYSRLIDGYITMGNIDEALKIKDDMVANGFTPNSVTQNSLLQGLCKVVDLSLLNKS